VTDLVIGGLVIFGVLAFTAEWWVTHPPRPDSQLRCGTCPKLAQQIRRRELALAGVVIGWLVTFVWALSR
jgi:hypothetical protein